MSIPCWLAPGTVRRVALLALLALLAFGAVLALSERANAAAFSGKFSPRIINGKADLNGDLVVTGRDDSNAFFGDTSIIDGMLDCDAWGPVANSGTAGNGIISSADDCHLIAYDGTSDGRAIEVIDGVFQFGNRLLPTVFNAGNPNDPSVKDADFAWSVRSGKVDSNGNGSITGQDCHLGLIGNTVDAGFGDPTDGADILANTSSNTNPCGFATPPNTAHNGLVDLNSDIDITSADSCSNSCFFGHDVKIGVVQAECPGFEGDPRNDVVGTPGDDQLSGTGGNDIICGLGGNDTLHGQGGADLILGGGGADEIRGEEGADVLRGGDGADHLFGGDGADHLFGNAGNDRLNGGDGFDRAFGGSGVDAFIDCEVTHQ